MTQIVEIVVKKMTESCERTTFYVNAYTDEGYSMTVASHQTGSIYTNHEGLSVEEARERALIDAADWGDFLLIEPTAYKEDGKIIEPSFTFDRFDTRRVLKERKENAG